MEKAHEVQRHKKKATFAPDDQRAKQTDHKQSANFF